MNIEELLKIEPSNWMIVLLICIATLFPGLLLIAIWDMDLFVSLETIKLILLSLSLTIPTWVINSLLVELHESPKCPKGEDNIVASSIIGAIINSLSIYMSLIIWWIFDCAIVFLVSFILIDIVLYFVLRRK